MRCFRFMLPIIACVSSIAFAQKPAKPEKPSQELPFRIAEDTTHITRPLTKDGLVDYETYLNQQFSQGVTPENNAAVFYLKAMGIGRNIFPEPAFFERLKKHLGTDPFAEGGPYLVEFPDVYKEISGKSEDEIKYRLWPANRPELKQPWKSDEHPIVKKWLDRNRVPLEHVLTGTRMPHHYSVLEHVEEENAIEYQVPSDAVMHPDFAVMLGVRANLSLGENRPEDAIRDALAIHRLVRHASPESSVAGMNFAAEVAANAYHPDQNLANSTSVSAEQLKKYLKQLNQLDPVNSFERGLWVERLLVLDLFQRACTTTPEVHSKDWPTWEMLGLKVDNKAIATMSSAFLKGIDFNAVMVEINQFYDRIDAGLKHDSYQERQEDLQDFLAGYKQRYEKYNTELIGGLAFFAAPQERARRMTSILLGAQAFHFETAHGSATAAVALEKLSLLGLALAAYQKTTGKFPDTLDVLVPGYLPELPLDPFTGKPFVLRVDAEGAVLYSLGPNLQDDGGKPPTVTVSLLSEVTFGADFDLPFRIQKMQKR